MGAARCPQPWLERGSTPGAGAWSEDGNSSLSPAAFEIKRRAQQHGSIRQGEGVRKQEARDEALPRLAPAARFPLVSQGHGNFCLISANLLCTILYPPT